MGVYLSKKGKLVFDYNEIKSDMDIEEITALIATGDRTSPEYGLTIMILKTLTSSNQLITKDKMYDLYMRNREYISKASFYRILNKLITRGMVIFDEKENVYRSSVYFSNALQRLAIAWESIVIKE